MRRIWRGLRGMCVPSFSFNFFWFFWAFFGGKAFLGAKAGAYMEGSSEKEEFLLGLLMLSRGDWLLTASLSSGGT